MNSLTHGTTVPTRSHQLAIGLISRLKPVLPALLVGTTIGPAAAVTFTWDGKDRDDSNWVGAPGALKNNWVSGHTPAANNTLVFAGMLRTISNNNTAAATTYESLGFASDAVAFNLTGNSVTLTNGVTNSSLNAQTIAMPIILNATHTFSGGPIAVNGAVTGTGRLNVMGKLGGVGSVGIQTTIAGKYSPGVNNDPGLQRFSNKLAFSSGSIFEWDLDAPATGGASVYDKIVATGIVSGSSTFNVVLGTNPSFENAFWNTPQSWPDIFSGSGTYLLSSLFPTFGGTGVSPTGLVAGQGVFSFKENTLNWTVVPEPSSVLFAGLLGMGLLRRQRC